MNRLIQVQGAMPFFLAVFLNAFVDLGHKITIQNTLFKLYNESDLIIFTAIINGIILLPYILLLSPAGFISDRFRKPEVMQKAAAFAVFVCFGITFSYYMGWFWIAFSMTLLLGIQSAILSPAKLGYIKELFGKDRLGEGNGAVSAITIVAILAGSFCFSILFEMRFTPDLTTSSDVLRAMTFIGWMLIITSVLEWIMTLRLPLIAPPNKNLNFNTKDFLMGKCIKDDIAPITQSSVIRLSAIGLATFWSVGQVMLAAFPAFLKEELGVINTIVVQGILACSGLGIAIGSIVAGRMSRDHIETGVLPIGALGIAIGLALLTHIQTTTGAALNFLFIGFMGGMFIVPLNSLVQFSAEEKALGKTLAANNWVQNIAMFFFLLLGVVFAKLGWSSKSLLQLIAVVAIIGSFYTIYKLPQSLTRLVFSYLLSRRYKVAVQGMKNIPASGGVLLLGNHVSWIDWAILQIASPRPVRFVMIRYIYEKWYLKWFFDLFGCIPIEQGPRSRNTLNDIAQLLNQGQVICLFPEGAISRTGHMVEFRRGYERTCEQTNNDVVIVPFYLRGLWGSQFSRSSQRLKKHSSTGLTRDLVVAFGKPISKDTKADILKRRVFDLSISSWQEYVKTLPSIAEKWILSTKKQSNKILLSDTIGLDFNGTKALTTSVILSRHIEQNDTNSTIGLLLPTSAMGMLTNMAGILAGKTIVNLNYTASSSSLKSAIEQAGIQHIFTSKKFVKKLESRGIDCSKICGNANYIYLEDIGKNITVLEKTLTYLFIRVMPAFVIRWCMPNMHKFNITGQEYFAQRPAIILFSSGSEGAPKGIEISHQNIMANVKQISDVLNPTNDDVLLANLPLFHAFGLTATQFMPLLEGIPIICHPDPTDALGGAKAIAKYKATIMFGTSSFLRLYIKNIKVKPLMLSSLRFVVAGAEKLSDTVKTEFKLKFNHDIYEGYGATETTPVASVNLPDQLSLSDWKIQIGNRKGSVGMPLPGTSCKIVNPETFEELSTNESGMILIGGEQVMLGYLNNIEKTEAAIYNEDGIRWYITGDKGRIDEDGFLFIEDRYSRFAKIAGEMVSLSMVEKAIYDIAATTQNEEFETLVVNIPDDKKGEALIALVNQEIDALEMNTQLKNNGLNPLAIPKAYKCVDEIPKLGSGKNDFGAAKKLAINDMK